MSEVNELKLNGLPEGWQWVELETLVENPKQDIVDGPFGSNLKSHEYVEKGIPVFKIQNIKANRFIDKNLSHVTEEKAKTLSRHSFKAGDLIITKLGDPLGLCCKVPDKYPQGIIVADLMRLRPSKRKVYDKFLINVINSDVVQSQFKTITKGTTRPRVNLTIVRDIKIPLPSLEVQQQIVSRIEELFSELDKSIEDLKTAQQQLKVYRQSVLKWAFEGTLTNASIKDRKLPEGWVVETLGNVSETCLGKMLDKQKNKGTLRPYLRNISVRWGSFDLNDLEQMKFEENELERYSLKKGDLVICEGGEPGRCAIWNLEDNSMMIQKALHRVRVNPCVNVKYVFYFIFFSGLTGKLEKYFTGTTIKHLTGKQLRKVEFPMPSKEEQQQIVQEIESRLSVADKVEETIVNSLEQAEALRQSILKKAFEGRLH